MKVNRDTERGPGCGTAPDCATLVYEPRAHQVLVERGHVHASNQMTFLQAVNSITESELKITVSMG